MARQLRVSYILQVVEIPESASIDAFAALCARSLLYSDRLLFIKSTASTDEAA